MPKIYKVPLNQLPKGDYETFSLQVGNKLEELLNVKLNKKQKNAVVTMFCYELIRYAALRKSLVTPSFRINNTSHVNAVTKKICLSFDMVPNERTSPIFDELFHTVFSIDYSVPITISVNQMFKGLI